MEAVLALTRGDVAAYVNALFTVYIILVFLKVLMSWIPRLPENAVVQSVADFIRALQFPETPEDKEGFRALRLALEDRTSSKLIRAAQWFLQRAPEHDWRECRFDVLAFASLLQPPEWICGAFTA